MDDIIAIIVIVAGLVIKVISSLRKQGPGSAEPPENDSSWRSLEDILGQEEAREYEEARQAAMARAQQEASAQQQYARQEAERIRRQAELDAGLLEQQRQLAALAAQAEELNRQNAAESMQFTAAPLMNEDADCNEDDENSSWAALIRNNPSEALILSEILSPPAALRH